MLFFHVRLSRTHPAVCTTQKVKYPISDCFVNMFIFLSRSYYNHQFTYMHVHVKLTYTSFHIHTLHNLNETVNTQAYMYMYV